MVKSLIPSSVALLAAMTFLAIPGCGGDKPGAKGAQTAADVKAIGQTDGTQTAAEAQAPVPFAPGTETPSLRVSDEIVRACNLPKKEYAPSFDFDSTSIGPEDRELLGALAKCLSEGPLRGRKVALVGRADPRGEDEYNMVLGGARADSVRRYLREMGVEDNRVGATSRGELDASGTDEAGWARDRRVDIELAN